MAVSRVGFGGSKPPILSSSRPCPLAKKLGKRVARDHLRARDPRADLRLSRDSREAERDCASGSFCTLRNQIQEKTDSARRRHRGGSGRGGERGKEGGRERERDGGRRDATIILGRRRRRRGSREAYRWRRKIAGVT
eukprot:3936375-Rhodomonas_salina.2